VAHGRDVIPTTPPADPTRPMRLPGQVEQEYRQQAMAGGMAVPNDFIDEIKALAGRKI
jgi:LDH2 family malate/lactate/ureidoglycolate dehydrogenase